MLHRTRVHLVRQRTMLVNAIRAHMAKFGIVPRAGGRHPRKMRIVVTGSAAILVLGLTWLARRPGPR